MNDEQRSDNTRAIQAFTHGMRTWFEEQQGTKASQLNNTTIVY
jgi:hypothetical protein